ncbi:hypothetical protein ACPPVQ_05975 [Diaminobutyricibacter sp. McL0618]|uniref:hypothetical protein n=1 Tax=Leifsonia sp. McL0618 TaxID=3415677 RepID=UPI003CE7F5F3
MNASAEPDELTTILTAALNSGLNDYGSQHGLPPLRWTLSSSELVDVEGAHPDAEYHPDAEPLIVRWAELLGAHELGDGEEDGSRMWDATVSGKINLSLFCITDREAHDRANAAWAN